MKNTIKDSCLFIHTSVFTFKNTYLLLWSFCSIGHLAHAYKITTKIDKYKTSYSSYIKNFKSFLVINSDIIRCM